jgi:hypothetical protein
MLFGHPQTGLQWLPEARSILKVNGISHLYTSSLTL